MPAVTLRSVTKRFDGVTAVNHVSFEVDEGELLTLLGPSGCGKTTTMRLIAGLEHNDTGEIYLKDQLISSAERGYFLAPEKRGIGMVFQSYAIWPHMTVFQNVAYPLRIRGLPKGIIREKTAAVLSLLGLEGLEERLATRLSGGQQQRVALARAIVFEPRVLLLDEPLSNLDAKLRNQMRVELKRLQKKTGLTTIYVTHDQAESMALSDRIIVMNSGRIEQIGRPKEIYEQPASQFVADFVGSINFIEGRVVQEAVIESLCTIVASSGLQLQCALAQELPVTVGEQVLLTIRPEKIRLRPIAVAAGRSALPSEADEDRVTRWHGRVEMDVYYGDHREYQVRAQDHLLLVVAPTGLEFGPGTDVTLEMSAQDFVVLSSWPGAEPPKMGAGGRSEGR